MEHIKKFENFLNEAANYSNKAMEDALEDAEFAFWQSIAKSFPQIKTGDFGPDEFADFREATKSALTIWLKNNS